MYSPTMMPTSKASGNRARIVSGIASIRSESSPPA
jgi:hypothetical protein